MIMRYGDCAPDCEERAMCERAGEIGHWQCGMCPDCNKPVHHCGHIKKEV